MIHTNVDEYLRRNERHDRPQPAAPGYSYEKNTVEIAATSGAFDLLTPGHIELFKTCSRLAGMTVVLLNTDESIRQYKGVCRPVKPWEDRAEILNTIRLVDHVIGFNELDPIAAIEKLKPTFWVKGNRPLAEVVEVDAVFRNGGQYISLWTDLKQSSTNYIRKAGEIHLAESPATEG